MSCARVLAAKTLLALADLGLGPEDITEVLAEMCEMHEEVLKEVDEECPMK